MMRAGVTLFEVMLSMLIMAIAVLSVALILPAGLKAQEGGRYKAVAAITAYNLINLAEHNRAVWYRMKNESNLPYGTTMMTHEPGKWDMERILSSSYWTRSAISPVPPDIARRLDSNDDEIGRILDAGGQIFFPSPLPAGLGDFEGSLRGDGASVSLVDEEISYAFDGFEEAGRLVIGFIGLPQQNALPSHPCTAAPYREWYPSPPATHIRNTVTPEGDVSDVLMDDPNNGTRDFLNRGSIDLAMWKMWSDLFPGASWEDDFLPMLRGFADYRTTGTIEVEDENGNITQQQVQISPDPVSGACCGGAHYELTLGKVTNPDRNKDFGEQYGDFDNRYLREDVEKWYGLCLDFLNKQLPSDRQFDPAKAEERLPTTISYHFETGHPTAQQVSAMRYFAAAAMWRTRTDLIDPTAEPEYGWKSVDGTLVYEPREKADGTGTNPLSTGPVADHEMYTAIHEHALRWAADYAEHRPYDWGAPRMYNRAIMMDNPLLQLDLFDGNKQWSTSGDNVINGLADPDRRKGYSPSYRIVAPQGCTEHIGGNQLVQADTLPPVWSEVDKYYDSARRNDIPVNYYGNWDCHENNYQIVHDRMSASWGRSEHFNLNEPFAAAERCRQMVIWAVDWQQYEDAERTAAVVSDASYYPWDALRTWTGYSADGSNDSLAYYRERGRGNLGFWGPLGQPLLWKESTYDAAGDPAWTGFEELGADGISMKVLMRGVTTRGSEGTAADLKGDGTTSAWLGWHGLDANGNGTIDVGSVPKSMRMRATVVARFNFYDQRTWQTVRN